MKLGLVGAHGSRFDKIILAELLRYERKATVSDLIDLQLNRDFLKETYEYDVVALFYIFIGPQETKTDLATCVSELHTQENWRKRLVQTKAKSIYVFGHYPESEVTGEYIGELDGYTMDVIKPKYGSIWRYIRNG